MAIYRRIISYLYRILLEKLAKKTVSSWIEMGRKSEKYM